MMFPLGCLIRKKATGIKIFSSPVAALDNADLAMSSGCDVKMYSFIPSGEAAQACQARPEIAHPTIATLANALRKLIIAHPPHCTARCLARRRQSLYEKEPAPLRGGPRIRKHMMRQTKPILIIWIALARRCSLLSLLRRSKPLTWWVQAD